MPSSPAAARRRSWTAAAWPASSAVGMIARNRRIGASLSQTRGGWPKPESTCEGARRQIPPGPPQAGGTIIVTVRISPIPGRCGESSQPLRYREHGIAQHGERGLRRAHAHVVTAAAELALLGTEPAVRPGDGDVDQANWLALGRTAWTRDAGNTHTEAGHEPRPSALRHCACNF